MALDLSISPDQSAQVADTIEQAAQKTGNTGVLDKIKQVVQKGGTTIGTIDSAWESLSKLLGVQSTTTITPPFSVPNASSQASSSNPDSFSEAISTPVKRDYTWWIVGGFSVVIVGIVLFFVLKKKKTVTS